MPLYDEEITNCKKNPFYKARNSKTKSSKNYFYDAFDNLAALPDFSIFKKEPHILQKKTLILRRIRNIFHKVE
jgi:hypothetical protein